MILDNDRLDQPERVTVPAADGSVTVVVSRCIRPDKVAEFEQWEHGINRAMEQFPGFLGNSPGLIPSWQAWLSLHPLYRRLMGKL